MKSTRPAELKTGKLATCKETNIAFIITSITDEISQESLDTVTYLQPKHTLVDYKNNNLCL